MSFRGSVQSFLQIVLFLFSFNGGPEGVKCWCSSSDVYFNTSEHSKKASSCSPVEVVSSPNGLISWKTSDLSFRETKEMEKTLREAPLSESQEVGGTQISLAQDSVLSYSPLDYDNFAQNASSTELDGLPATQLVEVQSRDVVLEVSEKAQEEDSSSGGEFGVGEKRSRSSLEDSSESSGIVKIPRVESQNPSSTELDELSATQLVEVQSREVVLEKEGGVKETNIRGGSFFAFLKVMIGDFFGNCCYYTDCFEREIHSFLLGKDNNLRQMAGLVIYDFSSIRNAFDSFLLTNLKEILKEDFLNFKIIALEVELRSYIRAVIAEFGAYLKRVSIINRDKVFDISRKTYQIFRQSCLLLKAYELHSKGIVEEEISKKLLRVFSDYISSAFEYNCRKMKSLTKEFKDIEVELFNRLCLADNSDEFANSLSQYQERFMKSTGSRIKRFWSRPNYSRINRSLLRTNFISLYEEKSKNRKKNKKVPHNQSLLDGFLVKGSVSVAPDSSSKVLDKDSLEGEDPLSLMPKKGILRYFSATPKTNHGERHLDVSRKKTKNRKKNKMVLHNQSLVDGFFVKSSVSVAPDSSSEVSDKDSLE